MIFTKCVDMKMRLKIEKNLKYIEMHDVNKTFPKACPSRLLYVMSRSKGSQAHAGGFQASLSVKAMPGFDSRYGLISGSRRILIPMVHANSNIFDWS